MVFDNYAKPQTYGVSGLANGFSTERDTEVRSMAQIGGTMFVGGNFAKVDKYADGTSVAQSYLAAFDAATRRLDLLVPPHLHGKVNAVAKLPSGLLAVGGEFTTVNGTAQAGLVVLDPATGAIASRLRGQDGVPVVVPDGARHRHRGPRRPGLAALRGRHLHARGRGRPSRRVRVRQARRAGGHRHRPARLDLEPGLQRGADLPDDVELRGPRVLRRVLHEHERQRHPGGEVRHGDDGVARQARERPRRLGRVDEPAQLPADRRRDRRPVLARRLGAHVLRLQPVRLLPGAPEHRAQRRRPGGDFQASVVDSGVAYGTCHCALSYVYGNSRTWNGPTNYDRVDTMRYVAAFDTTTGRDIPGYIPWITTRPPVAVGVDDRLEQLPVGRRRPDHHQAHDGLGVADERRLRGFCRADTTAPTVPTAAKTTKNADGTVKVSWTGSTDNASGTLKYTVFRDNLAVATVTGWSATLPAVAGTSTYAVRAVDKAGNTSATTVPVTVTVP